MANHHHDLRSQDNAAQPDPLAILPGQGGGDFVAHNITELKARIPLTRRGCHPRRLIDEINHKRFSTTRSFTPFRYDDFDRYGPLNHEHRLVFNGNQSSVSEYKKVISSLCLDCHYHFVFVMSCGLGQCTEDHARWPLPENAYPWHHLVWAGSEAQDVIRSQATKYYPLIAREYYACVSAPCTFDLTVDISEPRLDLAEQNLLMDQEAILSQLTKAREQEPARYEAATDDWAAQAPRNLNTYLKNMLDDQPKRSISKRNKRFAVIFGPRCFDLFRRLEFQEVVSEREDGEDEGTFTPQPTQPAASAQDAEAQDQTAAKAGDVETEIGSYRAFIEDVRTEVQSLIHRMGDSEEQPSFIHRVFHKNMGCSPAELKDRVFVDLERYKMLGVLPDQSAEAVVNAYYRQWERMAGSQKELIESLKQVANDLSDDRLTDYATMQATLFETLKDVQGNASNENEGTPLTRTGDAEKPVGLSNIGNTCYLNSLLQYLYTVRGVREVVNNFDNYKLELDDAKIAERKIGGNKMSMIRGEAVVAQAFVHELSDLFDALLTSDKEATQPTQRLANAVLLPTRSVIEDANAEIESQKEEAARPIYPLPPPRQTTSSVRFLEPDAEDVPMNSGLSTTAEHQEQETSSNSSATTLRDDIDNPPPYTVSSSDSAQEDSTNPSSGNDSQRPSADVPMLDVDPEQKADNQLIDVHEAFERDPDPGLDDKVLKALETQKRSSGTEQQDVEEVIGSIVSLLQSAIRPDREDSNTGIQYEKIMEMFFITTVNYTKKFGETTYQSEISYDRSITAFPSPHGVSNLYECLASNFDQQVLEGSNLSRYTAIRELPPILHVLIQRTQSDGRKNDKPVIIPETLYLDRYMDVDQKTPEFRRRNKEWALASRLRDLRQKATTDSEFGNVTEISDDRLGDALEGLDTREADTTNEDVSMADDPVEMRAEDDDWSFDGPVEEDFLLVNQNHAAVADQKEADAKYSWEGYQEADKEIEQMREDEWTHCQKQLNESVDATKNHAYRLEAVICHQGRLTSGHYWVWIRDFEDHVWRCYNDSNVKVYDNEDEVLEMLNSKGDPYYLCYVRDEDKKDWVSVPKRQTGERT